MSVNLTELEERLGVVFSNKNLLQQALTHRSYCNEDRQWIFGHNERLEFLGDAILELVVSEFLFRKYPNKSEGDLTSYRAALVNARANVATSQILGLDEYVRLSRGEAKNSGRARDIILADAFEAIIGATYLDRGLVVVEQMITRLVLSKANTIISGDLKKNTKTRLQENSQRLIEITPIYKVLKETGPDHNKEFVAGVFFNQDLIAQGTGPTKKLAEEQAAQAALVLKGWTAI